MLSASLLAAMKVIGVAPARRATAIAVLRGRQDIEDLHGDGRCRLA
jgi:hypothetical protein